MELGAPFPLGPQCSVLGSATRSHPCGDTNILALYKNNNTKRKIPPLRSHPTAARDMLAHKQPMGMDGACPARVPAPARSDRLGCAGDTAMPGTWHDRTLLPVPFPTQAVFAVTPRSCFTSCVETPGWSRVSSKGTQHSGIPCAGHHISLQPKPCCSRCWWGHSHPLLEVWSGAHVFPWAAPVMGQPR